MPHCIIEHSDDLNSKELVDAVYEGALNSQLFSENDIKTRAIKYEHYQTASQKKAFVHVSLKILSGRNIEQKSSLSNSVLDELKKLFESDISLTVEVLDIQRETYAKVVL